MNLMTAMATRPAYERDPYLAELHTEVVGAGADGGRPYAVLADTICYPAGGGQPADRGRLGDVEIVDTQRVAGEIHHYLSAPVPLGPATLRLDWQRRFDHMQQHTGQHLLTAVAHDRFAWPTTAFHLGDDVCDVELDVPTLTRPQLDALEDAVDAEVRAARPVSPRWVTPEQYATLAVRSRGLPAGHSGEIRLVEIAGLDLNTCGGTHLRSTAEIGSMKLLGTEAMRGGTRVFFVAGRRVLHRLERHERRTAALRVLLGAPDDELPAVLQAKLDELRALEKRARATEDDLAAATVEALVARAGVLIDSHFEGRDLPFLQRIGRGIAAASPSRAALLTAAAGGDACFLLTAGEALPLDVQAVGRQVAAALGGRGGGPARLFQGKAASLAGRDAAVAAVRQALPPEEP
jgi:alanyl-tRNA synthetase